MKSVWRIDRQKQLVLHGSEANPLMRPCPQAVWNEKHHCWTVELDGTIATTAAVMGQNNCETLWANAPSQDGEILGTIQYHDYCFDRKCCPRGSHLPGLNPNSP